MPEVRLARAVGDNQAVVDDIAALSDGPLSHAPRDEIDIDHVAKRNVRVPLVAQHIADRRGDVPFG